MAPKLDVLPSSRLLTLKDLVDSCLPEGYSVRIGRASYSMGGSDGNHFYSAPVLEIVHKTRILRLRWVTVELEPGYVDLAETGGLTVRNERGNPPIPVSQLEAWASSAGYAPVLTMDQKLRL